MQTFDNIVVLDFEATCDDQNPPEPQEVIEFPSVLVSLADGRVVDEFSSFVRPVHHPVLTRFCTELTSIEQADVDGAPTFPEVLEQHRAWLDGHDLLAPWGEPPRFAFVTCGDWDFATLFPTQCAASEILITDLPAQYREWINLKPVFEKTLRVKKAGGMVAMLKKLDLELEGRHHRGIDDCRNITRILLNIVARGAELDITGRLSRSRYPKLPLTLRHKNETREVVLTKRALRSLLGLAGGAFRRQALEARTPDGTVLDEARLLELRAGAILDVRLRGDP